MRGEGGIRRQRTPGDTGLNGVERGLKRSEHRPRPCGNRRAQQLDIWQADRGGRESALRGLNRVEQSPPALAARPPPSTDTIRPVKREKSEEDRSCRLETTATAPRGSAQPACTASNCSDTSMPRSKHAAPRAASETQWSEFSTACAGRPSDRRRSYCRNQRTCRPATGGARGRPAPPHARRSDSHCVVGRRRRQVSWHHLPLCQW